MKNIKHANRAQKRARSLMRGTASTLVLAATGLLLVNEALAQAPASQQVEQVVVTGSHITEPGFSSPTPVNSVSMQDIQVAATTQVYDLETDIPALIPNSWTQQSNSNPGASNFNLRGLGVTRTLTLIDGRRVAPTSYDGTVDVNILPVAIIQRVDVVTGGASAAYGSDAIGGVVNVILENKFEGLKGNIQGGESQYSDNKEQDYNAAFGTEFAGGRGHVVVAGEIYTNGGGDQGQARRPAYHSDNGSGPALVVNGGYTADGKNGPKMVAVNGGAVFGKMTEGGVIDSGPLKGIYFADGGAPQQMTYGQYCCGGTFMIGGSGGTFANLANVTPALDRQTLYTHASYDLTDNFTVWADLLYAHVYNETSVTPNYDNGTLTIQADNYYIPASVKALALASGVTNFSYGRENLEFGINIPETTYNDIRAEGGANGTFGGGWSWDTTYQFSQNLYKYLLLNNRNQTNWALGTDAVANPAVGGVAGVPTGQPVCRSTIANPANGCVPVDVFGTGVINKSMINYINGTSFNYYHQQQWDITANVQGTPFSTWAGPVAVALGGELRRNFITSTADAGSLAKIWRTNNVQPFAGAESVQEGYIEVDVPLLSGAAFAKALSINAAGRYTNYNTFGGVEPWKVGVEWSINDDLRFRATRSHDIRAPNLNDLYSAAGSQAGALIDRRTNQQYNSAYGIGGNPFLQPEVSDTFTGGVVYSPSWLDGFTASVDYYRISIAGAITVPGTQGIEDNCEVYKQTNFCQYITRSPSTGLITFIQDLEFNSAKLITDGLDISASYAMPASSFWPSWGGNLQYKLDITDIDRLQTTNVGITTDQAGGQTPHWRGNLRGTYTSDDDKITVSVLLRYIGDTKYNKTYVDGVDINRNEISSALYTNFDASYQLFDSIKVYGKINNALNITPPLSTASFIEPPYNTNNNFYDIIGRTYAAGVRFNF